MNANLTDRAVLKRYLYQYDHARKRCSILGERLAQIQESLEHPSVGAAPLSAMPSGSNVSDGAATLILREEEIRERYDRQKRAMDGARKNVQHILTFLPTHSMERDVLELRHVDLLSWKETAAVVHLVRSSCNDYYNKGLDMLLEKLEVRSILRLDGTETLHRD